MFLMDYRITIILVFLVLTLSCARRGRPEGGPRDEEKPVLVKTDPEFKSIHFDTDEIKIYFDEYIKLKELTSQLIVSPPLKYPPVITPQGTPSKKITIKIKDTLQENTTYTFNFGQSIIDNTEGNILSNFKYIFSTGDYIDSLQVKGTIKDAFDLEMIENPTIMLYPVGDVFNDSVIYNEKPMYVGSTIDSVNWNITNIKAGKYLLLALNDNSKNYKFNPKEDKIGFYTDFIDVPVDSTTSFEIKLFNEILPFKIPSKAKELSKGHIIVGYEGIGKDFSAHTISETTSDFKSLTTFDVKKDTLHYWFKNYDKDSILLSLNNIKPFDTVRVKLKSKEIDTMVVKSGVTGALHLRDTLKLESNTPIVKIDTSKILLLDKDSVKVQLSAVISKNKEKVSLNFKKEQADSYNLEVLPGAIKDFFGIENDTLNVKFTTRKTTDYSSIFLTLNNIKSYPIIIDLLNDRGEVVVQKYSEEPREYKYINLQPSRYKVRIIYDTNNNKKWDTGNYLLKQQPEEVYYFKNIITAKANWEVIQPLTIK